MRIAIALLAWIYCWHRMCKETDKSWDFVAGLSLGNLIAAVAYETY